MILPAFLEALAGAVSSSSPMAFFEAKIIPTLVNPLELMVTEVFPFLAFWIFLFRSAFFLAAWFLAVVLAGDLAATLATALATFFGATLVADLATAFVETVLVADFFGVATLAT